MAKSDKTEVAKAQPTALVARPSFIEANDNRGRESITREDIKMPMLGVAQKMSPQLDKMHPSYIQGLEQGDMFNTLTGQIYGPGPIELVVVRADPAHAIEFHPIESGGGIKERDVPLTDPRTKFGKNGEKPLATKFYDFVVLLLPLDRESPMNNLLVWSLKATGIKVAKQLNGLLQQGNCATFARRYEVSVVAAQSTAGSYYTFGVRLLGWVEDKGIFDTSAQLFDFIKEKKLDVEREPGDDDPDSPGGM